MTKAHKIRLYPTEEQENLFRRSCGIARYSYNWALTKWQDMYFAGEKPSVYGLVKLQNSIKKTEMPFFSEVSKNAPQYAIHGLGVAFKKYFERLKDGTIDRQKSEYISKRRRKGLPLNQKKLADLGKPKFKRKGDGDSFIAIDSDKAFYEVFHPDFKLHIPCVGKVKCAENLRFKGKVNHVRISRVADMWFASINMEVPESIPALKPNTGDNQAIVGIDFGLTSLMVLSDGTIYEAPKVYKRNLKKIKRMQRTFARKQNGSKNWQKIKVKLGRQHYRVSCIRSNFIHEATTAIINKYDRVVIEDLNVMGLLFNHKISQSVSDAAFGEIRRQLAYKALWQQKEVVLANRFFASSQICSGCGNKKTELKLSDRTYNCISCGLVIDRDLNAAQNLANYGTTQELGGSQAFGVGSPQSEMIDSPSENKEVINLQTRVLANPVNESYY